MCGCVNFCIYVYARCMACVILACTCTDVESTQFLSRFIAAKVMCVCVCVCVREGLCACE